jgi:type I restriction enzyme S subunit
MNRIEKLIAELCPDGVEWKKLGEVAEEFRERNTNLLISDVWSVTNSYGLIRTGEFFDSVRTSKDKSNYKIVEKDMFVYNPARINVGSIARHKESFKIIVSPMYIVVKIDKSKLFPKYFELFLSSNLGKQQILNKVEVGVRFRLTYEAFANIKLPLPPLCIQEEIAKILDTFTELEAALEAELEARRKQYEYYRNKLLTPVEHNGRWYLNGVEVEWKKLGEVAIKISSGGTPKTGVHEYYENGNIPWLRTQEVNFCEIYDTEIKITELGLKNSSAKIIPPNCVIMAMYGATVGKVAINKIPLSTNQACANIQVNDKIANTRYIFYYLSKQYKYIKSLGTGSQTNINSKIVQDLNIPIPPLSEQERIVAILDKFDALVNDISQGLPAEIEARRKQYEYYRNKLLTFNKK